MKRYGGLYQKTCSFENLYLAYLKARKGKRYKDEILKFGYHLEANLLKLQEELLNQSYKHGSYRTFIVNDSKKRLIKAAPFRDRVVHHALCNIIEPIFDRGFIHDSYACRKEKGTHRAIKRIESFMRSIFSKRSSPREVYCLQCDISKYFASIDHNILIKLIRKRVKDKKALWLIEEIIDSSYEDKFFENLFEFKLKGIPIGNLTSQLFANIYLNELDQFAKRGLLAKYYLRYMDDFIILDINKKRLHGHRALIQEFLEQELKLNLHSRKVNVFSAHQGINMLGYRFFKSYKLLRKDTVKRFIKRTKLYQNELSQGLIEEQKIVRSIKSWLSYAEIANSWNLRQQILAKLNFQKKSLTSDQARN